MSAALDQVLTQVAELSNEELITLLAQIANQLYRNVASNSADTAPKTSDNFLQIEGSYRLTPEQAKAGLAEIFEPSDLAAIEATDITHLPPLPKSLAEMISEDREDRF